MSSLAITSNKLAPEQKLFNQLLEKIEACGQSITELTRLADAHRVERFAKVNPLIEALHQWEIKFVLFLDARLQHPKGLSKKQQENIAYIALEIAERLFCSGKGSDELDAVMKRLADLLNGDDDLLQDAALDLQAGPSPEEKKDQFREIVEGMTGVSLEGEEGLDSFEEMMFAAMRKRQAAEQAWVDDRQARKTTKKKSAKEIA